MFVARGWVLPCVSLSFATSHAGQVAEGFNECFVLNVTKYQITPRNDFIGCLEFLRNQGKGSYVCIGRSRVAVDFWYLSSVCSFVLYGYPLLDGLLVEKRVEPISKQ